MSAFPGKVRVVGVTDIFGEKVFVLELIQARDGHHVGKPFFAKFDPAASWFDDLRPAFGESQFFFESQKSSLNGDAGIKRIPPSMTTYEHDFDTGTTGD